MGVKEVDKAFTAMIDMSGEILNIGRPRTKFSALKTVIPTPPRIQVDFEIVETIESLNTPVLEKEYLPLFTELKRFEPSALTFSSIEPGQGVTFTARNIARLWAKEESKKILLLEFYNGFSGSEYSNIQDEDGDVFSNSQLLEEYLSYAQEDNLYLYSVRSSSINVDIGEFWQRVSSSFDLIIIDAAPKGFNIMTDKAIERSTGVIMISSQKPDPVNVKVFERETKELGGRFLGVILNAVD